MSKSPDRAEIRQIERHGKVTIKQTEDEKKQQDYATARGALFRLHYIY